MSGGPERSRGGVGARSGTRRAATAEFPAARVLQERRIAGTVGDGSSAAATAERCRRRPGRLARRSLGEGGRPKRSQATMERAQRLAGLRGPRYVLRPDASGRVARFPRAPGQADPAEGAQRPEPQGDQRERVRRPAARPKAQRRPQVRRRLRRARLPCRAQRRAGALHGGRHDVTLPQRRNAGDGGLDARRLPRGPLHRAGRPPGPTAPLPQDGR